MTQEDVTRAHDQTPFQDSVSSVYIIFQQPPYSCPFVRAVVQNEREADEIVNRLSGGSSLYKFWKKNSRFSKERCDDARV
jgi:hypothetical protein